MSWHTTEPIIPLGKPAWPSLRGDRDYLVDEIHDAIGRMGAFRGLIENRLASIEQNVTRRHVDLDNQRVAMMKAADAYAIARAHSEQIAQLQTDLKRLSQRRAGKRSKRITQ